MFNAFDLPAEEHEPQHLQLAQPELYHNGFEFFLRLMSILPDNAPMPCTQTADCQQVLVFYVLQPLFIANCSRIGYS